MTRKEFFGRTLGGILAAIGLSKTAKAEEPNIKAYVEKAVSFIRKYPLTEKEAFKNKNYLQIFREEYHVIDGQVNHKVFFNNGKLEVTDPELAESLRNHPRCKKQ